MGENERHCWGPGGGTVFREEKGERVLRSLRSLRTTGPPMSS